MGLQPIELMSEAYLNWQGPVPKHDEKIRELERRRREVKRDYDALQKARSVEADIPEAEVIED